MPEKYSKDAPFEDPVLRCDSCAKIVYREDLHKFGMCPNCGNRKVRSLLSFTDGEMNVMVARGVDPEFLKRFRMAEEVPV